MQRQKFAALASRQLESIRACLSLPAASSSAVSNSGTRAIVGCLLRRPRVAAREEKEDDHHSLDCLYILRAVTEKKNRWSGHVAFPGGHSEVGETDEDTLFREVKEEIGLDMKSHKDGITYLGALQPKTVPRTDQEAMELICRVYYLHDTALAHSDLSLQDDEIAASCWCPLSAVCNLDERVPYGGESPWKAFPSVCLPIRDKHLKIGDRAASLRTTHDIKSRFKLWGLTLAMCDELLTRAGLMFSHSRGIFDNGFTLKPGVDATKATPAVRGWDSDAILPHEMHSGNFYKEARRRNKL